MSRMLSSQIQSFVMLWNGGRWNTQRYRYPLDCRSKVCETEQDKNPVKGMTKEKKNNFNMQQREKNTDIIDSLRSLDSFVFFFVSQNTFIINVIVDAVIVWWSRMRSTMCVCVYNSASTLHMHVTIDSPIHSPTLILCQALTAKMFFKTPMLKYIFFDGIIN